MFTGPKMKAAFYLTMLQAKNRKKSYQNIFRSIWRILAAVSNYIGEMVAVKSAPQHLNGRKASLVTNPRILNLEIEGTMRRSE
jgi:hypothetical protein